MTTENQTPTEVAQDAAPQTEKKKRGRKPAAKKLQKTEDNNTEEAPKQARKPRAPRKKKEASQAIEPQKDDIAPAIQEVSVQEAPVESAVEPKEEPQVAPETKPEPAPVTVQAERIVSKPEPREIKVLPLPVMTISSIIDLYQAPQRAIILTDQQIQTLTLEEIEKRHEFLEQALANILDYDVVISDTNVWLELLIGHTSSHSDPRFNARLQFERQLEFISKFTQYRKGRFMIMGETYEEIDRFASMQDPTNHREADWTDNIVCLNAAARLAKRLILAQQKENRLRIEGIGAESHHASFADPAIVRKVAELFAQGKKVLLLTNDASVAIRSLGICDDLQRHNNIPDAEWDELYAPLRPMVFTFDDLKLLDYYTRQYHYIQMAAGQPWMCDIPRSMPRTAVNPLTLWQDAFRPGDKHRGDNLFTEQEKQQVQQQQKQKQQQQNQQKQPTQQQQQKQKQQQQRAVAPAPSQSTPQPQQAQPVPEQPAPQQETAPQPQPEGEQKPAQKPRSKSRRRPQKPRQGTAEQPKE